MTEHGNLILDPEFSGKIFLKGLLLENDPERYKYGYNLLQGYVDRDRRRLTNPKHEANILSRIWGEAIHKDKENTLDKYINLLRDDRLWTDVNLAKLYIAEETAQAIWQYLLEEDPEKEIFYHDHENGGRVYLLILVSNWPQD